MREIVGAKINGSTITNSLPKIVEAARAGRLGEVYDRTQMQFMSGCDLGRNWDLMASGPTLFLIGDDGKPQWPNALGQEPCAAVCARSPAPEGYTSGTTEKE